MVILADGKVGIGVANPGAPLEVAGFIRASDGLESNAANKMQVGTRQAQPLELMTSNKAALTIDTVSGNAVVNNVYLGDVGHGYTWAGFSHKDQVGQLSYGLLQSQDGFYTLINKKYGGGYIGFRINNSDVVIISEIDGFRVKGTAGFEYNSWFFGGVYFAKGVIFAGGKTGYVVDHFVNRVGDTLEQGDVVVISRSESSIYSGADNIAPIEVGDLLTTSPTRGHAQKVLDKAQATGAILGKALASLSRGKGKIPVMVMLQ
jgi:hypothetical protein